MIESPSPTELLTPPSAWERRPLLILEDALKVREQGDSRFELHIPEFHVLRGEFIAIAGESGCGKSTLLDLLALISRPTHCGRFLLNLGRGPQPLIDLAALWEQGDEERLARARLHHLGYVLQTGGLLPYLSVRRNLLLPGRLKGVPDAADRLQDLARQLGIHEVLGRLPHKLSGGQRQRAAILRALLHRPQLVLADEPTAAVDKARARGIVETLRELARSQGMAVLMVTHDHDLVRDYADRVYGFRVESLGANLTRSLCA